MFVTSSPLETAFAHFRRGELAQAEALLVHIPQHASALHLMGILRTQQGRLTEAADYLAKSIALEPREAQSQLNYGKVLTALARHREAIACLKAALVLAPGLSAALPYLARNLEALEEFEEAAAAYRTYHEDNPTDGVIAFRFGNMLIGLNRYDEAVEVLKNSLSLTTNMPLAADLNQALAAALRSSNPTQAFSHLERAQRLDPPRTRLDMDKAALLQEEKSFEKAKSLYEAILSRQPDNIGAHEGYNDLLYRLGADEAFLSSYDRAPWSPPLAHSKARFLLATDRGCEAEAVYGRILASDPDDSQARTGLGLALIQQEKFEIAAQVLESAAARHPESADIWCNLSGLMARMDDPEKGTAMASRALELDPHNQIGLALLGTNLRLIGSDQDEALAGYDKFVQVLDVAPPAGFSDINAFNAELNNSLDRFHSHERQFLRQSLRGGSQTSEDLFARRDPLVEKLRTTLIETIRGYIADLGHGAEHPFLRRTGSGYRFSGSWSSRLRSNGFHINHVHPGGWISSCYYVEVPSAVQHGKKRDGWLKFGEPSFKTRLGPHSFIQPEAGKLVLFPSYLWHGTVPFQDNHDRTTVAFDVVPA